VSPAQTELLAAAKRLMDIMLEHQYPKSGARLRAAIQAVDREEAQAKKEECLPDCMCICGWPRKSRVHKFSVNPCPYKAKKHADGCPIVQRDPAGSNGGVR
jgi:hypothetical protein